MNMMINIEKTPAEVTLGQMLPTRRVESFHYTDLRNLIGEFPASIGKAEASADDYSRLVDTTRLPVFDGKLFGLVDVAALPLRTAVGAEPVFEFLSLHHDISTFAGADTLDGEDGEDILLGQQGGDTIRGGLGDDDLIGGHNISGGIDGDDNLDGGGGDDVIVGDNAIVTRLPAQTSPNPRLASPPPAPWSRPATCTSTSWRTPPPWAPTKPAARL